MRKFAFVVFDIDNTILDRFSLDLVTELSGLGFKLTLSTVNGDVENILTKVVQEKIDAKMTINFVKNSYQKSNILVQWLQKYSGADARLALEYDDGTKKRYSEGKVVQLDKSEKDEFGDLAQAATFRPLTPFFQNIQNEIKIEMAASGKSYPFRYPYAYGKNQVTNDEINNPYILDIPVTVKISGTVEHPDVQLLDEAGEAYNRVRFPDLTLQEGQYVLINSAARKIWYFDGATLVDYSAETDPSFDTFLRAKTGVSKISINFAPSDSGILTGSWRQYSL